MFYNSRRNLFNTASLKPVCYL